MVKLVTLLVTLQTESPGGRALTLMKLGPPAAAAAAAAAGVADTTGPDGGNRADAGMDVGGGGQEDDGAQDPLLVPHAKGGSGCWTELSWTDMWSLGQQATLLPALGELQVVGLSQGQAEELLLVRCGG